MNTKILALTSLSAMTFWVGVGCGDDNCSKTLTCDVGDDDSVGGGATSSASSGGSGGAGGQATTTSGSGGGGMGGEEPTGSCGGLAPTCGAGDNESCCTVLAVPGGTFNRFNNANYPATISGFGLDKFETTVARFRRFVEDYPASRPSAGHGAHPLIANSGWNAAWDGRLPSTRAGLEQELLCDATVATWTSAEGPNDDKPITCVSWYLAMAFCAWDGGRLPTIAEAQFVLVGGDQQRVYPWSSPPTSTVISPANAAYDCTGDGSAGGNCTSADIIEVGKKSPQGDGRWGHANLVGNAREWVVDVLAMSGDPPVPCIDCADLTFDSPSIRLLAGGAFNTQQNNLVNGAAFNDQSTVSDPSRAHGIRCARD